MQDKNALKYKLIERFLILVGIWGLSIGAILLFHQMDQYATSKDAYKELREEIIVDEDDYKVDWEKMKDYDVVGWIRFPYEPKVIDYPVVQGKTNSDYIRTMYNGESNIAGSIFMNCNNKPDFSDANTIIYGHNMADGTMFNKLKNYEDKEFWYQNSYFYIYLPDNTRHTYKIFSVSNVMDGTEPYTISFTSKEAYGEFVQHMIEASLYNTEVSEANADHRMITLSTCTPYGSGSGHRKIIQAVETEVVHK